MKIIFLDFDGVLCTARAVISQGDVAKVWHMNAFDREAIGMLNWLVEKFKGDLQFVISSTWRKNYDQEWIETHLRRFGFVGTLHEDWRTDPTPSRRNRGGDIQDWLNRHPEITEFAILDDDGDMWEEQKPRFVQTAVLDGMLYEHFVKLCSIFGVKAPMYL